VEQMTNTKLLPRVPEGLLLEWSDASMAMTFTVAESPVVEVSVHRAGALKGSAATSV